MLSEVGHESSLLATVDLGGRDHRRYDPPMRVGCGRRRAVQLIAGCHPPRLYLGVVVRGIATHLAASLDYLVYLFEQILDFIVRLLLGRRADRFGPHNYRMLFHGVLLLARERAAAGLGLLVQTQFLRLVLDQVVQRHIEKGESIEIGVGSRLSGGGGFGGGHGSRLLLRCSYVETIFDSLWILLSIELLLLLVVST